MWEALKSKKFKAFLGGVLIALGSALAEKIGWNQAIISIVMLVMSYLGVETAVDIARAKFTAENYRQSKKKR